LVSVPLYSNWTWNVIVGIAREIPVDQLCAIWPRFAPMLGKELGGVATSGSVLLFE
jgi:hypothetical protein